MPTFSKSLSFDSVVFSLFTTTLPLSHSVFQQFVNDATFCQLLFESFLFPFCVCCRVSSSVG
jgi:hypothetical protein